MSRHHHIIVGIHVHDRIKQVPDLQTLFTEFGCSIKTRLGIHDAEEGRCSASGIILLETIGDKAQVDTLIERLKHIPGIDVQKMVFEHND